MNPIFFIARLTIILIGKTIRTIVIDEENLVRARNKSGNVIYALWHNRNFLLSYILRGQGINVIVSRSKDGEFASRILKSLGYRVVRGSTGKGGGRALQELIERLNKGEDAAINPDGPQGPKYHAYPGIVYLAGRTFRPIVPMAYSAGRKIILKSWDNFIIPIPFSRAVHVYGEPIYVEEKFPLEEKRHEIEHKLNKVTSQADEYFEPQVKR